jgi:DNA-directed RNA polymerase subunit E'/Rpb7
MKIAEEETKELNEMRKRVKNLKRSPDEISLEREVNHKKGKKGSLKVTAQIRMRILSVSHKEKAKSSST